MAKPRGSRSSVVEEAEAEASSCRETASSPQTQPQKEVHTQLWPTLVALQQITQFLSNFKKYQTAMATLVPETVTSEPVQRDTPVNLTTFLFSVVTNQCDRGAHSLPHPIKSRGNAEARE